jgi:hypothetical protein
MPRCSSPPPPHPNSDFLFKLLLIGDSGVGKSCLLLRFAVRAEVSLCPDLALLRVERWSLLFHSLSSLDFFFLCLFFFFAPSPRCCSSFVVRLLSRCVLFVSFEPFCVFSLTSVHPGRHIHRELHQHHRRGFCALFPTKRLSRSCVASLLWLLPTLLTTNVFEWCGCGRLYSGCLHPSLPVVDAHRAE